MPKKNHPMKKLMSAMLTEQQVYDLLVADFARDGHPNAKPLQLVLDDPSAGLGYRTITAAQAFLNQYVNSTSGRQRYNLGSNRVAFTDVPPPRTVSRLAYTIFQAQHL